MRRVSAAVVWLLTDALSPITPHFPLEISGREHYIQERCTEVSSLDLRCKSTVYPLG